MPDHPLLRHPAILLLHEAVRREQRLQLLACMGLLCLGLTFCYVFFTYSIFLTILGLFFTVLGIKFTYESLQRRRPEDHPLMQLLRYQPHRIVWVYAMVVERMPFGFRLSQSGALYFKLIDGDELSISLPKRHLKLVSRTLNRLLPHASFGYTKDREQWFLASPELLLRHNEDDRSAG